MKIELRLCFVISSNYKTVYYLSVNQKAMSPAQVSNQG